MNILDQLFTEEQATALAQKVLDATKAKIDEQLTQAFYDNIQSYLHETYDNAEGNIKKKMISDLADEYVKDPSNYLHADIRRRIWTEHKDEIMAALTSDIITDNINRVFNQYCSPEYYFNWKWKDNIVTFILSNWDSFKDDERIANGFGREIERLKSRIQILELKNSILEKEED